MGRIKTQQIKRTTQEIIKLYGDELDTDYQKNKLFIEKHLSTDSKKIKNIVAGYATRLAKSKE